MGNEEIKDEFNIITTPPEPYHVDRYDELVSVLVNDEKFIQRLLDRLVICVEKEIVGPTFVKKLTIKIKES